MTRIKCATSQSSTVGAYLFTRNPSKVDFQPTQYKESISILHGAAVWHSALWDDRPRQLTWTSLTTAIATENMITSARGWIGKVRYWNFKDLEILNKNWPVSDSWKKARVLDAYAEPDTGGRLKYTQFIIILQPEKV